MGDQHGPEGQLIGKTDKRTDCNKQQHHRDTGHDIGVHHRNVGDTLNGGAQNIAFHLDHADSGSCADDGGDDRGADCENQCVFERGECLGAVEQLPVPVQRKAVEGTGVAGFIEGEQHQYQNGDVQKHEHHRNIDFGKVFHERLRSSFRWDERRRLSALQAAGVFLTVREAVHDCERNENQNHHDERNRRADVVGRITLELAFNGITDQLKGTAAELLGNIER